MPQRPSVRSDNPVDEKTIKEKTVGVQQATTGAAFATEKLGLTDVQVYDEQGSMFTALRAGQIDAAMTDTAITLAEEVNGGGKVLVIDVGLSRVFDSRPRMACLVIENGKPYALHRGEKLELPSDSDGDLLRYLRQAAVLDPSPSSLERRITELEAGRTVPATK